MEGFPGAASSRSRVAIHSVDFGADARYYGGVVSAPSCRPDFAICSVVLLEGSAQGFVCARAPKSATHGLSSGS